MFSTDFNLFYSPVAVFRSAYHGGADGPNDIRLLTALKEALPGKLLEVSERILRKSSYQSSLTHDRYAYVPADLRDVTVP